MKKFVFPAIAEKYDEIMNYCVSFPDLQGCTTTGISLEECQRNAVDALELHLAGMLEDGDEIPTPSDKNSFDLTENEQVFLVEVTLPDFNEKEVKTFVPLDLYNMAEAAGIDFSAILVRELQAELKLQ
ncbi:MAG: type II toxin-antitoxin system HicB family antitoxin [Thermoguttaceae bacterium]|nr:type II toxin-antitoxin system HicB family antitoxin [Thermoguttaceae bacterium]